MKCHYEVLSLERDVDEAQIKTAYRKAALKYHPDKNLDDPDGAKALFQLVQQAYEVLSDPQERAWYDRHREQILKGSGSEYEDNALCVFQYFTASCYSGFGDDAKGFYTIFRDVFAQLATEEIEHLESEAEYEAIPKFGDSSSDYEDVVQPFYAFWQSFCTNKSYAWLSTHNINDIRDRRILKVVEKENKKVQQKARKERNEEIRGLVSFVRKRDKRVQAHRKVMEDRAAENRKRQAQLDLEQVLRRKHELAEQVKQSNIVDHEYEERLRQLERGMQSTDEEEGEGGDRDADDEDQLADQFQDVHIDDLDAVTGDCEFFCVACNKTFKNQSSYRNHESSKKHKENVELIKREMLRDEVALHSEEEDEESTVDKLNEELELEEEVVEPSSSSKGKKRKQKGKSTVKPAVLDSSVDEEEEEEQASNMFLGAAAQQSDDDDDWGVSANRSKAKSKAKAVATKKGKRKKGSKNTDPAAAAAAPPPKKPVDSSSSDHESEAALDIDHKCVTCAEQFSSKNKLFMHLKKTNHGVYIPKGKVVTQADVPELRRGKGGKRK